MVVEEKYIHFNIKGKNVKKLCQIN